MGASGEGRDRVAVVVCSRDRPAMLAPALDSIVASLRPGDELVVVDSASRTSATAETARERGLRVERADLPGLSRARNVGVAASRAPVILFTDDDCLADPGWVANMASAFDADPDVGFAFGRVMSDREGGLGVALLVDEEPRRYGASDDLLSMGHGANMALRRSMLEKIGEFDVDLGAGARFPACEDTDIVWRALAEGATGAYVPGAVVVHRQWRSQRAMLRLRYGYGIGCGAFAVKMRQRDRAAGMALFRRVAVSDGALRSLRELLGGRRGVAANLMARAIGAVVGALRASWSRAWAGST
jgi:GT2 family glycosyltransferase